MVYYIGVDGGATKSSAAVAFNNGKIINQKWGSALNYHSIGKSQCEKNLRKLLQPLVKKYRPIKKIVMGLAGLDTPEDLKVYKKIVLKVLPKKIKFSLLNDAQIALESACPNHQYPRILIISGTGSSIYGKFGKNEAKSVGWGFILGDQGSAFWIGQKALIKATKSWDGRARKTVLEKQILKKTGKKNFKELIPTIYELRLEKPEEFRRYIASFAVSLSKASSLKDPVAREIIKEAADELALGVRAVIKRLRIKEGELLCVGFTGSTFKSPGLLPALVGKIKEAHPKVHFVYNVNPVQGAVNLAIKQKYD